MTWYAHRIYASPCEPIQKTLASIPGVDGHLFAVKDLDLVNWHSEEVKHTLPEDGLLVAKELSSLLDEHAGEWFGDEKLGFEQLPSISPSGVRLTRESLVESQGRSEVQIVNPPSGLLAYLKKLAKENSATVSLYCGATWGGTVEYEFAWVFDDAEAYYACESEATEVENGTYWYCTGDGDSGTGEGTVLQEMMRLHGVNLPTYFFAPHTRTFRWERYQVRS